MESSGKFERIFLKMLEEEMTAGAGGALGGGSSYNPPGQINSADTYAPGDARLPKALGAVQTRKGTAGKKKKKKRKEENEEGFPEEDAEKKKKADRCKRRADSVYGKKTSAYKSGAIVRCRQGKIWKKK